MVYSHAFICLLALWAICGCSAGPAEKNERSRNEPKAVSMTPAAGDSSATVGDSHPAEKIKVIRETTSQDPVPSDPGIKGDRIQIVQRIREKIMRGEALVIDLYVPLCDNVHQGIVPVNRSLGDGFNLKTNLYWGAGYGIGHYFNTHRDWSLVRVFEKPDSATAEVRIYRLRSNPTPVYLVARAYWGDQMRSCLVDYFNAMAGRRDQSWPINDSLTIQTGSNTDLICFNGHNGLMDIRPDVIWDSDTLLRDAVVIGCVSHAYFKDYLRAAGGYPLVTTTNFMAPEAYVIEPVIRHWVQLRSGEAIRLSAGDGYHRVQQCGLRGARNLFRTGW